MAPLHSNLGDKVRLRLKEKKKSVKLKVDQLKLSNLKSRRTKERNNLKDLWITTKHTNLCKIGVSEGEEKRKGQKEYLKK